MTSSVCNETATLIVGAAESNEMTELVRGTEQRLLDHVAPMVRQQSILLDLSRIERIDAAGIAALIRLYGNACDTGHQFAVFNASPRVAQILSIVGLDRILVSHNTVPSSYSGPLLEWPAA